MGRRKPVQSDADIEQFLARDYARLVAGLALLSGSRAEAEEAVQEAMVRALEGRGQAWPELFKGWVAVVARNIMRDRFRHLRIERLVHRRIVERDVPDSVGLSVADARMDLVRALRVLPARQREAIVLRYFADLSVQELAGVLRSNENATKALLFRARAALAGAMGISSMEEANEHAGS